MKKFDSLKPRGKPQGREWGVLAGVVVQDTTVNCGHVAIRVFYSTTAVLPSRLSSREYSIYQVYHCPFWERSWAGMADDAFGTRYDASTRSLVPGSP